MKSVWKLILLIGIIVLAAVTAFVYIVFSMAHPAEIPLPLLVVCGVIAAAGCAASGVFAVYTKRYTTATGFG